MRDNMEPDPFMKRITILVRMESLKPEGASKSIFLGLQAKPP